MSNIESDNKSANKVCANNDNMLGAGIAIGTGVGVAVGVAINNIAAGFAIGVGFGVAIGATLQAKTIRKEGKGKD